MKRIIILILCVIMLLSLFACEPAKPGTSADESTAQSKETSAESSAEMNKETSEETGETGTAARKSFAQQYVGAAEGYADAVKEFKKGSNNEFLPGEQHYAVIRKEHGFEEMKAYAEKLIEEAYNAGSISGLYNNIQNGAEESFNSKGVFRYYPYPDGDERNSGAAVEVRADGTVRYALAWGREDLSALWSPVGENEYSGAMDFALKYIEKTHKDIVPKSADIVCVTDRTAGIPALVEIRFDSPAAINVEYPKANAAARFYGSYMGDSHIEWYSCEFALDPGYELTEVKTITAPEAWEKVLDGDSEGDAVRADKLLDCVILDYCGRYVNFYGDEEGRICIPCWEFLLKLKDGETAVVRTRAY